MRKAKARTYYCEGKNEFISVLKAKTDCVPAKCLNLCKVHNYRIVGRIFSLRGKKGGKK